MDSSQQPFSSWEDLYQINWIPKELFLKLRKHVKGYRLGMNLELNNFQLEDCNTKIVLKPLRTERKWKFVYEPIHGDIRLMTHKISIGRLLKLQVGIGHCFENNSTGFKWKLTTLLGGEGFSTVQHKLLLPIFPGVDVRFGLNADFVPPDIHGSMGTDEPVVGMNFGRLTASLDRMEAILTHKA